MKSLHRLSHGMRGRAWARVVLGLLVISAMPACQPASASAAAIPVVDLPDDARVWSINHYVSNRLLTGTDRKTWVQQWIDAPMPDDATRLLVRLNLMVRDDQPAQIKATLDALEKLDQAFEPGDRGKLQRWTDITDFLIDWEQDQLAREIIERRPEMKPDNIRTLLARWHRQVGLAIADAWLIERQQAYRAHRAQSDSIKVPLSLNTRYWTHVRMQVYRWRKAFPTLVTDCEARARAEPDDLQAQLDFIIVARNQSVNQPTPVPTAWMLDHLRRLGAYDAYRVGEALARGPWPTEGIALLEHSLATAFTEADESAILSLSRDRAGWREILTREHLERSLRRQTKEALAEAYVKNDQADRAQPIIEALAKVSGQDIPVSLAELAGRTQARTSLRTIEDRVLKAEPESKDDPKYWHRRAKYFQGRAEWGQAESAYLKAIELSPLSEVEEKIKPSAYQRASAIRDWGYFLKRQHRIDEWCDKLWAELGTVDPTHPYARRIIDQLWHSHSGSLTIDQPLLWDWLAAQPEWDFLESHVLMSMAEVSKPHHIIKTRVERRPELWERATELTLDADVSRATTLGFVMSRYDGNAQARPLLESALKKIEDPEARGRVRWNLLGVFIELDDFDAALAIWPKARRHLGAKEVMRWLPKTIEAAEAANHPTADRWRAIYQNLAR